MADQQSTVFQDEPMSWEFAYFALCVFLVMGYLWFIIHKLEQLDESDRRLGKVLDHQEWRLNALRERIEKLEEK